MPEPITFAGISISREEAEKFVAAEIRPPIKRGDLDQLDAGSVVAIIDGELNESSVLPTDEITRALRRGVRISGAASLGALRAHEACAEGMGGYGWVYEAYCMGRLTGTDEIAVLYHPDTYRPLTIPLVNVRFCLDQLATCCDIDAGEADQVMASLKQLGLENRDGRSVLLRLSHALGRKRMKKIIAMVRSAEADIKRRDAEALLCILAQGITPRPL